MTRNWRRHLPPGRWLLLLCIVIASLATASTGTSAPAAASRGATASGSAVSRGAATSGRSRRPFHATAVAGSPPTTWPQPAASGSVAASGSRVVAGVVPASVLQHPAALGDRLPGSSRLTVALLLASRNPGGFQSAVEAVDNPSSPQYHHYLSPSTVLARFGPDPAAVADLVAWLRSRGLAPRRWTGGRLLDVDGTAARFAAAFGTELKLASPAVGSSRLGDSVGQFQQAPRPATAVAGAPRPAAAGTPVGRASIRPQSTPADEMQIVCSNRPQPRGTREAGRSLPSCRSWRPISLKSEASAVAGAPTAVGRASIRPQSEASAVAGTNLAGNLLYAPDRDPSVPTRFAGLVQTIVGLSGTSRLIAMPSADLKPQAQAPSAGYDPTQIADAYNFTALYNAGYHGEHTRAALVEFTPYDPADIATYARWAGTKPILHDIPVDGGDASASPQLEATLDIELLSAMAPRASIDVYDAPADSTGGSLLDVYSLVAATDVQVLSTSWTVCEAKAARIPGLVTAEHAIFDQMHLQGTTIVAATGDTGAYACATRSSAGSPGVNLPASDPYVLAVAATELTLGPPVAGRSTYGFEKAWSCAGDMPECDDRSPKGDGSGGGTSALFYTGDAYDDDLSWQGPLPNGKPGKARRLPDVSISGSNTAHEYAVYFKRQWNVGGGTSASAPVWAALILLTDQYLEAHNRPSAGWIDPAVYQLGHSLQMLPPYHDVTEGDNLLYHATVGWDYATGWGSPYAWNFTLDLACLEGVCPEGAARR